MKPNLGVVGQAAAFVAPTSETTAAVNSWLQQHGINSTALTPAGDWLKIETTVGQANELFGANYNVYVHDTSGKQVLRTLEYSLPEELANHITVVHPTVRYPDLLLMDVLVYIDIDVSAFRAS